MIDKNIAAKGGRNERGNRDNGSRTLLDRIRSVDFALVETVLYLDAYPESAEAQKLYRKLLNERRVLVDSYEGKYGPLTMYGNHGDEWMWTKGPWPWEADAN